MANSGIWKRVKLRENLSFDNVIVSRGSNKERKKPFIPFLPPETSLGHSVTFLPYIIWGVLSQQWETADSACWATVENSRKYWSLPVAADTVTALLCPILGLAEIKARQNWDAVQCEPVICHLNYITSDLLIGNQFFGDICSFSFLSKIVYSRKTAGIHRSKIFTSTFTDKPNVQNNSCYPNLIQLLNKL